VRRTGQRNATKPIHDVWHKAFCTSLLHLPPPHPSSPSLLNCSQYLSPSTPNSFILQPLPQLDFFSSSLNSFNPVALTLMVKALNRVISQQTRLNSRERPFFTPGKELIDALAESAGGDVRSAVNSLQFACSKGVYTKTSKLSCVCVCVGSR